MRPASSPRRGRRHHLHGLRSGTRQPLPLPGARPARLSDLILAILGVAVLGALALVLAVEFTRGAVAP